jgi:hypothetical protein
MICRGTGCKLWRAQFRCPISQRGAVEKMLRPSDKPMLPGYREIAMSRVRTVSS